MRYRVKFMLHRYVYYTEWFETFDEGMEFASIANATGNDVFPLAIEDEEGNVV